MKVKNYLLALLAAASLMACSNDEENSDLAQGKAWVGVSFTLTQPTGTKAADGNDVNAEVIETKVNTISVYLQNEGTVAGYTKIAELADFTQSGLTYTSTNAIEVTGSVGATRNLLVIVNEPAALSTAASFGADGQATYTITGLSDLVATLGAAPTNGIPMVNTEVVKATLVATAAAAAVSKTTVNVERLVAKAQLTESMGLDAGDVNDFQPGGGSTGKFKQNSLEWQIKNSNLSMFLPKKADEDPNMSTTFGSDYEVAPYSTWVTIPNQTAASATGYDASGVPSEIQYFTENVNTDYVYGNTTYMSVQAGFMPNEWVTTYSSDLDLELNTNTDPATFYYVVEAKKYLDQTAGIAALADAGNTGLTIWGPYVDGVCYYSIPVGTNFPATTLDQLGAIRNNFYKANITSLIAPGLPKEPDPIDPVIKQKVWLAVEMLIEPWNVVDMGNIGLGN